jgi:hypothetical protein
LPPVDDASVLAPARACAEQNLSSEPVCRLEQHNVVPALRAYPSGLEAGWPAAHHHHSAAGSIGALDRMRQRRFSPRRGIMQAVRTVLRLAVGRADTRPDPLLLTGFDLAHDMRVGDVSPGHRHHVEQSLAWRRAVAMSEIGAWNLATARHVDCRRDEPWAR